MDRLNARKESHDGSGVGVIVAVKTCGAGRGVSIAFGGAQAAVINNVAIETMIDDLSMKRSPLNIVNWKNKETD
jgi:hypothetical protein